MMWWRLSAAIGVVASLGFVAGIDHVWEHRPDPSAVGLRLALAHPHYLRPYSPNARVLFACVAVGAVSLASVPLLYSRGRPRPRVWQASLLIGVVCSVTLVGAGMFIYRHPPSHRACYVDDNQTAGRKSTICQTEPDRVLGVQIGRSLIGASGGAVLITIVSLPLLAGSQRRRPTPA